MSLQCHVLIVGGDWIRPAGATPITVVSAGTIWTDDPERAVAVARVACRRARPAVLC